MNTSQLILKQLIREIKSTKSIRELLLVTFALHPFLFFAALFELIKLSFKEVMYG